MKPPTMRSSLAVTLLLASSLPAAVNAEMLFKGCYKSVDWMKDLGSYTYQSSGYCQNQCQDMDKPVLALWKGSNCLCGDKLPSKSKKVSKDQCNVVAMVGPKIC
ncbi:WSC domain protein, partial [Aspergillus sclerotialis]